MMKYPEVMNIRLLMTNEEFREVIDSNSCCSHLRTYDDFYFVDSNNENEILEAIIRNNKLRLFEIKNWKDFFCFDNSMSFENIVEIFRNYYLRLFECESILYSETNILEYSTKDWSVFINYSLETITVKVSSFDD